MISFQKIKLEDRTWMEPYLKESQFRGCDYAFGNLYIWGEPSQIEVADYAGMLCIRSRSWQEKTPIYTFPAGNGDLEQAVTGMLSEAKEGGYQFHIRGFAAAEAERLETCFPGKFQIESVREEWDYIYLREKLATLSGKKYHGKRNHIARFQDTGEWRFEPITEETLEDCRKMNDAWCRLYGCVQSKDLSLEQCAVRKAFDYYFELKFQGGVLYQEEKPVAFTIGEPLNEDTFVVHIEKAFPDIQGAYPMINQQFVLHCTGGYQYVNREEDLGQEGLRKAKLSYKPELLLEKYCAIEQK